MMHVADVCSYVYDNRKLGNAAVHVHIFICFLCG